MQNALRKQSNPYKDKETEISTSRPITRSQANKQISSPTQDKTFTESYQVEEEINSHLSFQGNTLNEFSNIDGFRSIVTPNVTSTTGEYTEDPNLYCYSTCIYGRK